MVNLDNFKFTTEDNEEYVILVNKYINHNYYGYAVNLNDESDSMFIKIILDGDSIAFETTNDSNIIKELLELINKV